MRAVVEPGLVEHRFPGGFVGADADLFVTANEREPEQERLPFDFEEQFGVGLLEVFEAGLFKGFAFAIEEIRKGEAVDETFDLTGGHGFELEVDEVDGDAPLLEEAFGGPGGLGVFDAEDLYAAHCFLVSPERVALRWQTDA